LFDLKAGSEKQGNKKAKDENWYQTFQPEGPMNVDFFHVSKPLL